MKLKQFIFALVAMLSGFAFTANAQVAKVGNTAYATIDEALANWTAGSTLTLLADVTLPGVVEINSNESRTLDLGTFTMTAANKKDAFNYVVKGCTSDVGLSIKADATNPGGINAPGKAIIRHTKPLLNAPAKDRPYTQFFGGVFNASYIVYQGGTIGSGYTGASAPRFVFHGGEFNGTIYANRSKFIFNGGTFKGNIQISVDSSADALVKGGKFKNLSNMFGSALNTDKFTIGSAEGVYDRGIYVDKDGYYVITSAPITEVSAKYPAVKKESYNSSNYFYYSAAATYGMFYEDVAMAPEGSEIWEKPAVNVPAVDQLFKPEATEEEKAVVEEAVAEIEYNTAVKEYTVEVPAEVKSFEIELTEVEVSVDNAGEETETQTVEKVTYTVTPANAAGEKVSTPSEAITFRLPVPAKWAKEFAKVFHNGEELGIYEVLTKNGAKYVEITSANFSEFALVAYAPAAKIGETYYETPQAAINAAQNGDIVVISAGEFGAINISNKNITIQGTVGENDELLTTIKGGNPAITGHGFNGTIKDIKIVDAFKVMYAEPAGNVTVDNIYVTGATYGLHLVAYSRDLTWTIQNSYMDLSWANSFGVYGDGDAAIVVKGNKFESTSPYYPDYGALHVNTFLPNVTVQENIFGENAKILIRNSVTDLSQINISKNYHADGVENAFVDDEDGVKVDITEYYASVDANGALTDLVTVVVKLQGEGTESNPYLINTVEDLVFFRNKVNSGDTKYNAEGVYVALGANIDLAGIDWSVNIGDDCNATFDGIFDGKNFTISNLTAVETAEKGDGYICTGLFGAIYGNAVVKNLTIENVSIEAPYAGNNVAAVVGFAYSAKGSIENVKVIGDININAPLAIGVGAIVGYDYYSPALKVENCIVDGANITAAAYAGGLVGYASSKIAINNNTVENINVTATGSVGAVAGIMLGGSSADANTIKNVALSATGELWANSAAVVAGTISGGAVTVANTTVENVTANGAEASLVGGLLVEKPTTAIAKVEARIGNKYYATLDAARAAVKDGETVTLLVDLVLSETLNFTNTITIDGDGHKVIPADATATYNSAFMVGDSGWGDDHGETITLKNFVFEGWNTQYGVVRAQGVTLNVEGCEFNGNSVANAAYAVLSLNYTDATVANCQFVGNYDRAIDVNYNADSSQAVVTVNGCTFDGNTTNGAGIIYKNAGDVKVLYSTFVDNTVSTNGNAATVYTGWGDGDQVIGCTFENNTVTTSHTATKRFASAIFCDGCVVNDNVFGDGNTATRNGESISTIVAVGAYYGAANLSGNYWNREDQPEKGVDFTVEYTRNEVAIENYYADAAKTELVGYIANLIKEYVINDSEQVVYTHTEDMFVGKLTYKRTLAMGAWNPLFVPFEISIDELAENYEIAYYNQMLSYDKNNDGVFEAYDMEIAKLTSGTVRANYPLFISPKTEDACELVYEVENATLYVAEEYYLPTTSASNKFELYATHVGKDLSDLSGYLTLGMNGWTTPNSSLKAGRMYLKISSNSNSPFASSAPARSAGIVVRGEDGTTDIEGVVVEQNEEAIYDLSGRRVLKAEKGGIYIINGKKVLVK